MFEDEIFVDLSPVAAQLEMVAGLLVAPPPIGVLQQTVAEQIRDLVESIAALPRESSADEFMGWTGFCEGDSVEASREDVQISGVLGAGGELLWVDLHSDSGAHWHISYEGLFSGVEALSVGSGFSLGGNLAGTRMALSISTDDGDVVSSQITDDGGVVDCLDVESGIEEAMEHLQNSIERIDESIDESFDESFEGEGEISEGAEAGLPGGVEGGMNFPGGALGRRIARGAVAGLAGAAAAKVAQAARRKKEELPPRQKEMPREAEPEQDSSGQPVPVHEKDEITWDEPSDMPADLPMDGATTPLPDGVLIPPAEAIRIPVEDISDPGRWFFMKKGEQFGPVSGTVIKKMVDDGELEERSQVWSEVLPKWVRVNEVPGILSDSVPLPQVVEEPPAEEKPPADEKPIAVWVLINEGEPYDRIELGQEFSIGRSRSCDLVLDDQASSGKHAVIRASDDVFVLSDQKSTNGTFVNGGRILMPTQLRQDDVIRFGTTIYRFVNEAEVEVFDKTQMLPVATAPIAKSEIPGLAPRSCKGCDVELPDSADYCITCGEKSISPSTGEMKQPKGVSDSSVQTCTRCGADFGAKNKFCIRCGEPAQSSKNLQIMFCGQCGVELERNARFCGRCGCKVTG